MQQEVFLHHWGFKLARLDEAALLGIHADDLFSRWRALRVFRNTMKYERVATVMIDGRSMGSAL